MKPPCRFFGSEAGCRYGDSCMYSHDGESTAHRGVPRGRGRGRGRGRYQSRGMMTSSGQQDRQWYEDESDQENISPPMSAQNSKTGSRLNDLLSFGLKPTPEGWEEYAAIQRAFKEYDEDVNMEEGGAADGTVNEFMSFGLKPSPDGWGERDNADFVGRARGRGSVPFHSGHPASDGVNPFHNRGRGFRRPRGRF